MTFNLLNTKAYPYLKPYKQLNYTGNKDLLNSICITVVGSRKITSYGTAVISDLCKNCSIYPLVTVSGYVEGVDFNVFKHSLLNAIPTIVCLGYGFNFFDIEKFNNLYNKYSTKKDLSDVLILSQFENTQNASKWTFPKRDDLLASIGSVTLVIEAAKKSGTFYTVKQAIKEKKPVFAVPGSIYSQTSEGTNNLLKTGFYNTKAHVYTNYLDILNILKLNNKGKTNTKLTQTLTSDENVVLIALSGDTHHFDDILSLTKINENTLRSILTKLELKEIIKFDGKGYFRVG